jgi:hypothetical protein
LGAGQSKGDENMKKRLFHLYDKPMKQFMSSAVMMFDPNKDVSDDENNRWIAGVAYHIDKQHRTWFSLIMIPWIIKFWKI